MASKNTLTLLSLPPELILDIADHLPPDALISLRLTHHKFNHTLPSSPRLATSTPLTRCARLAIQTYLTPPKPPPSHIRCVLCKALYPAPLFSSASSPACLPLPDASGRSRNEVVELPDRFCAWHVGRLTRVVHVASGERNEWTSRVEKMCMHCGAVEGWARCACACQSCGWRQVRTYTRYLNNRRECSTFVFWKKDDAGVGSGEGGGVLFVRETCREDDETGRTTTINLPVRFEDEQRDGQQIPPLRLP